MDFNTPELTRIFRDELEERSGRLVAGAVALRNEELDDGRIQDLIRDAHTIKGSAGLLGYDEIKEVASRLEHLWKQIGEGYRPPGDVVVAMEASAGRLLPSLDVDDDELAAIADKLIPGEWAESLQGTVWSPPAEVIPLRRPEPGSLGGLLTSVSDSLLGGSTRVDTGELYRLINRIVEVSLHSEALADLSLLSIEGSDPALFRKSWRQQLERLASSISEIQDQAVALANIPFRDATATFPQFVRYLGRRMGKDVRFELVGDDVQLDRQIVDLLREPLRHLLVNAVDHGIEPSAARVAAGKKATGTVNVGAEIIDERVEVSVSDDGAGIDWDRVADVATERAIPFVFSDLSPILFQPGFTTTDEVTDFSGAGDGLAAVRDIVEKVNGVVHVESPEGMGTRVTMTLPLSMVLQNVVVVATGDQFWGLPEASIEAAMPLSRAEINATDSGREVRFQSREIPCVSLAKAMGVAGVGDESELLVINTRFGLVAITVSELIDRRRVAVKNLGPILEGPGHVTGAALLGGGQVLVVLDPNFLGYLARRRPGLVGHRPRILVVDDSAGVRQLLSATLNGAGFEVEVAAGAREAMLAMGNDGFEAMVIDFSMPRSNGVELVRAMRASDVKVPIVMVSGVATQEEKQAAWEAGVDAYLDKFDLRQGVLTATLRRMIGVEEGVDAG
ncbi:MAG TPA: response regulator [Acidimicrobiia bacterium]|nr:response regulator [Acidimicrobiia bacterium]